MMDSESRIFKSRPEGFKICKSCGIGIGIGIPQGSSPNALVEFELMH
jgi:hypothetical protein